MRACYALSMPKRSRKLPADPNARAKKVVDELTNPELRPEPTPPPGATYTPPTEPEKNAAAVALGRLGGRKGGPARAKALSAKKRSEIAKKAAKARWGTK
jgi:hypothetical protein